MELLYYFGISFFVLYISSICIIYGIPKSISDSFYLLEKGYKDIKWNMSYAFTIFCYVICFSIMPVWLEHTPKILQFIPFIAASALAFVGTAPYFKTINKKIHFISAIICMIFAILWIYLVAIKYWYVPLNIALMFLILYLLNRKSWMFYLEMWAFMSLFTSLILYIND
jgi:hypothetical protein